MPISLSYLLCIPESRAGQLLGKPSRHVNYIATDDLKVAVNAAVALERPLLIRGEPGTSRRFWPMNWRSSSATRRR